MQELGYKRSELVVSTKIFFGTGSDKPNTKGLSRKHIIEGTKGRGMSTLRTAQLDPPVCVSCCVMPSLGSCPVVGACTPAAQQLPQR